MRFEAPDSRNRWDSPLFTIQKEDTLPFEEICNAIFHRKAPPPNQSTLNVDRMVKKAFSMLAFIAQPIDYRSWDVIVEIVQDIGESSSEQPLSSTNFMYELDRVTQEMIM
eukprot:g33687.t1